MRKQHYLLAKFEYNSIIHEGEEKSYVSKKGVFSTHFSSILTPRLIHKVSFRYLVQLIVLMLPHSVSMPRVICGQGVTLPPACLSHWLLAQSSPMCKRSTRH